MSGANAGANAGPSKEDDGMVIEAAVEDPESPEVQARAAGRQFVLAGAVFASTLPAHVAGDKAELRATILGEIEKNSMSPYYEAVCKRLGWTVDSALLDKYRKKNEEDLAKLDAAIKDAKENQGDVEVADAMIKKAAYFVQIGDKDKAVAAYAEVPEKPLSTGQKIDVAMSVARLGFLHDDWKAAEAKLAAAKELNEKGGDWDRRNRLKVYEGAYSIARRDLGKAAGLLLDSIATFTATEVLSYEHFIFLTVLTGLKSLDRPTLKKKVIDSPDVISVIGSIPHLQQLLHSYYEGRYGDFFAALVGIYPALQRDRFFSKHAPYYLREMRTAAYNQFLESYKSVTLAGMAKTFAVTPSFLDRELSRFIAAGRLNAKIDAVSGIVETTRPDAKNAQYHAVIKQGDALLNKVQKLSRVIAI